MPRSPGASIISLGEQSCTSGATTKINFDMAIWEEPSPGWYDDRYPTRVIAQVSGLYQVNWSVYCQAGNGVGMRSVTLLLNGSNTVPPCVNRSAASNQGFDLDGSVQLELNANDYLELNFYHTDGGILKVGSLNSDLKNRIDLVKLSDL